MNVRLDISEQITIGVWLSAAIGMGIHSRSMSIAGSVLLLGLFFTSPFVAARAIKARSTVLRAAGMLTLSVWLLLLVFGLLETVERLYYVNAPAHYPTWLTTRPLKQDETLSDLERQECKGRGVTEITELSSGGYLVRCGFMWHDSKIFTTERDLFKDAK